MFEPEQPWPCPSRDDCYFYHSMDLPNGEQVAGTWDIRGRFDQYVGEYPLHGKSVLDVGTASGFLAFSAEAKGARVTALDAKTAEEYCTVPFKSNAARDPQIAIRYVQSQKNGFWYCWQKLNSEVEVVYAPLVQLHQWQRRFDIVIAGAIIEHLSDPISVIGNLTRLANEAVILAFTEIYDSDDLSMRTINDWSRPEYDHSWWLLSRGLYRRVFENQGFSLEIAQCSASYNPDSYNKLSQPLEVTRPTIVARRR